MDLILETLSEMIKDNFLIAPILALIAGILTSFTPCSLSTIPLVIASVSAGSENNTKKSFRLSLVFAIGSAITFTIFGVVASLAGNLIGTSSSIWYVILGILMVLMALQTWEIFEIVKPSYLISKNNKKGYLGALIAGILGGIFSSPCSTPVLIALLVIVTSSGNLLFGTLLLFMYSVGHGILAVITGTSVGFVTKLTKSEKYAKFSKIIKIVLGLLMLLIGLYMFYLGF